jgi:hypothetical protein
MKTTALKLAMVAGCALSGAAQAQVVATADAQTLTLGGPVRTLLAPGVEVPSDYQQRLIQNVYQANLAGPLTFFLGIPGVYDDMRYNALLGATPDVNVDDMTILMAIQAANPETAARVRVELYNTHTPGAVFPPYSVPLAVEDFDFPAGSFVNTGAGAVAINVVVGGWDPIINTGDNTISAFVTVLTPDGTAIHPSIRPVIVRNTAPSIGASLGGVYLDTNFDGAIGTGEGPFVTAAGDTAAVAAFTLAGDVAIPLPAGTIDLGTITACTNSLQTANVPANGVAFYRFTVPAGGGLNGVFAADLEALTIDTEGTAGTIDPVLALYDNRGNLIFVEDDDGSDANAQMSFGVGRWNGPGNAVQYDGRDLGLGAGEYVLAVAAFAPGLFFDDGYLVTATNPAAEQVQLNIRSYNNTCLPSVDLPTIDSNIGEVFGPAVLAEVLSTTGATSGLRWYSFSTCAEVSDPSKFFDVDFSASTGDLVAVVFDANGNQVAVSDDADASAIDGIDYTLPQFSFGNIGPRVAGGLGALGLEGQDGALPAGQYYMAVGAFPFFTLPAAVGEVTGRFHAFAFAPAAAASIQPIITTDLNSEDCGTVGTCPACPADFDQDGGVTGADVEAFFLAFEAGDPCGDTDLDGGVTGADVEAFFVAFENGGC